MYDIESITQNGPVAVASSSEKTFRRRLICAVVATASMMYMAASGFSTPTGGIFDRALDHKDHGHEAHDGAHEGHMRALFARSLDHKDHGHEAHDGAHDGHMRTLFDRALDHKDHGHEAHDGAHEGH